MQSFIAIDVDLMAKIDKANRQISNESTRDLVLLPKLTRRRQNNYDNAKSSW